MDVTFLMDALVDDCWADYTKPDRDPEAPPVVYYPDRLLNAGVIRELWERRMGFDDVPPELLAAWRGRGVLYVPSSMGVVSERVPSMLKALAWMGRDLTGERAEVLERFNRDR